MLRIRLYFLRYIFCFYLGTVMLLSYTMERWSGRFFDRGACAGFIGHPKLFFRVIKYDFHLLR